MTQSTANKMTIPAEDDESSATQNAGPTKEDPLSDEKSQRMLYAIWQSLQMTSSDKPGGVT